MLARVARGQTSTAIARALCVERSTVETHVRNAMRRTDTGTRLQAAALALIDTQGTALTRLTATTTDAGVHIRSDAVPQPETPTALRALPSAPWRLDPTVLVTGTVEDDGDVTAVVLALVRGASVDVCVPNGRDAERARLMDALARIDRIVTAADATTRPQLGSEDEALVALLVAGYSLAEAGAELGYSRRTLQRRLVTPPARARRVDEPRSRDHRHAPVGGPATTYRRSRG